MPSRPAMNSCLSAASSKTRPKTCPATKNWRGARSCWEMRYRCRNQNELRNKPRTYLTRHVCQPILPPLELERQPLVVQTQEVQKRGVKIVHVHGPLGDRVA